MDYFEEIEPYLNNELLPEERQEFETELAKNADLRRDVAEYRLLFELMRGSKEPQYDAEHERLRNVVLKAHGLPVSDEKKPTPVPGIPIATPIIVLPKIDENTEGGKVVELKPVKDKNYWWAAAAAAALLIGVGIWWSQNLTMRMPPPSVVQTQTPTDTLIKNEVKTPQTIAAVEPKAPPQYPTPKKVEKPIQQGNTPQKEPNSTTKADEPRFDEQDFAIVETALQSEMNTRRSRGNGTVESDKLLNGLKQIQLKKPTEAIELLANSKEPEAAFYRALATLLMNHEEGKKQLQAIADDVFNVSNKKSRESPQNQKAVSLKST